MKPGIRTRLASAATALALAASLVVPFAGAAPAAGVSASGVCVPVAPNVWVLPLTSADLVFAPGQAMTFRVFIRNGSSCADMPWMVTDWVTSTDGHVWGYAPTGPMRGTAPAGTTASTTLVVTAPAFYSARADIYIKVTTMVSAPGFHWTVRMSD